MKETKKNMDFHEALKVMKEGNPVKRPSWMGYWRWEENTIMVYTGDFRRRPLLPSDYPERTFDILAAEDFEEVPWLLNSLRNAWWHVRDIRDELDALPSTMSNEKKQGYENLRLLLSGTPMKARNEASYWTYTEHMHLTCQYREGNGDDFDEITFSTVYPHNFYEYIPATTVNCAALKAACAGEKVLKLQSIDREAVAMHAFVAAYLKNMKASVSTKRGEIEHLIHYILSSESEEEISKDDKLQSYFKVLNIWRTGCRDV